MLMLVCVPAVGTKLEWQTIHTQCRSLKQDCHKEFTSAARKLAMSTRKLKKKLKNKWELSGSQRETHDEATSVGQDYVLWVLLLDCASNYVTQGVRIFETGQDRKSLMHYRITCNQPTKSLKSVTKWHSQGFLEKKASVLLNKVPWMTLLSSLCIQDLVQVIKGNGQLFFPASDQFR